jgi:hypothetical protein
MIPFGRSWASGLWDLSEGGTLLIKRSAYWKISTRREV